MPVLIGKCKQCNAKREVQLTDQPYTSAATGKLMILVTANCTTCGEAVDMTWAHLPFVDVGEPDDA